MVETAASHRDALPSSSDSNLDVESQQLKQPHQKPLSCSMCRQRKVKCDKISPCAGCKHYGYECIYPPRRERKPRKKPQNAEIIQRLGKLEKLLEKYESAIPRSQSPGLLEESQFGSNVAHTNQDSNSMFIYPSPPTSVGSSLDRYMSSDFWSSLGDQIAGVKELLVELSDSDSDDDQGSSSATSIGLPAHFIFGTNLSQSPPLHPPVPQLKLLCRHFIANVHPIIPIFHGPSLETLLQSAISASDLESISNDASMTAVLFSIYFAAASTMADSECIIHLGSSRNTALLTYKRNAEKALAKADLLNKPDLGTLQALTIYLFTIRADDEGPAAWTLTGLAIRIAFNLGLHREGSHLNHTPYEIQLRRRLWWELYVLDVRAAEDRGSLPVIYEGSYNTLKPSNINDDEFSPQAQMITSREGWTDTTFGLILYETFSIIKKINYIASSCGERCTLSLQQKQTLVDDLRNLITGKYLVHCNTAIPFQWFASTCTHIWFSRMQLMLQYPVQPLHRLQPDIGPRNDALFSIAVDAVENTYLLQTNPDAARWYWPSRSWSSWHAFAIMLAGLCTRSLDSVISERAWKVASLVFEPWSKQVADSRRGMLWRPIRKLFEKALEVRMRREEDNASQGVDTLETIDFGDYRIPFIPMMVNHISYHEADDCVEAESEMATGEKADMFNWDDNMGFNLNGQAKNVSQWMGFEAQDQ